jgi:hypothetical protein
MRLVFEDNGIEQTIETVTERDIEEVLKKLDGTKFPYAILESDNGNFIQCAGGKDSLVVEVRLFFGDSFKHFVVGRKNISKVWHTVYCKIGPIRVLGHEELNLECALEIFKDFCANNNVMIEYNMRNITKQFTS